MAMQCEVGKSYLDRLPLELIENIAEWIPPSSNALLHLRRVNRELREKTARVVKRRYFEDRAFMVADPESMHVLLQISQHPVYAKSMKRIEFSLLTLPTRKDFSERIGYIRSEERAAPASRELRIRRREGSKAFPQLEQRMRDFRDEGHTPRRLEGRLRNFNRAGNSADQGVLEDILDNFKAVGNIPAIVTSLTHAAWGVSRYRREIGYPDCFINDRDNVHPYAILNEALCITDYPITHLELGCCDYGCNLNIFHFRGNDPYLTLKTLRLIAGAGTYIGNESFRAREERFKGDVEAFVQFLLIDAPNLEVLTLGVEEHWDNVLRKDMVFLALFAAATLPEEPGQTPLRKVRELELVRLEVDYERLVEFVRVMKATLTSLMLRWIYDYEHSSVGLEGRLREAHGGESFQIEIVPVRDLDLR